VAKVDANAIFEFLRMESVVSRVTATQSTNSSNEANLAGTANAKDARNAAVTVSPLAAVEPLIAPQSGVVSFAVDVGAVVKQGDVVATLTDPMTGRSSEVRAGTSGILFARASVRWATAGRRLCKIAGKHVIRSGKLLSP
jgi:uncharacterized protein